MGNYRREVLEACEHGRRLLFRYRAKPYADAHPEIASGVNTKGASASAVSLSSSASSSSSYNSLSASPTSTPVKSKTTKAGSGALAKSPPKSKKDRFLANGLGNGGGGAPCKDCGQIHKEIFEFARVPKRAKGQKGKKVGAKKRVDVDYYGMEWESIVKKVIDEWGTFSKSQALAVCTISRRNVHNVPSHPARVQDARQNRCN
ncbi:hypothetical protein C8R42DRAFT_637105 [Lentinula raphanica]|nr:hypothetical protein C8R42DRAFT_637105 [Lentinula raphanica]